MSHVVVEVPEDKRPLLGGEDALFSLTCFSVQQITLHGQLSPFMKQPFHQSPSFVSVFICQGCLYLSLIISLMAASCLCACMSSLRLMAGKEGFAGDGTLCARLIAATYATSCLLAASLPSQAARTASLSSSFPT